MKDHTIILLGGNSLKNKNWIHNMGKHLKLHYTTIDFFYDHREKNLQDINFHKEIEKLSQLIKDNNLKNYSIVAKSAGFLLGLQGVSSGILKPRTIVGFGLPLEYSNYREIDPKDLVNAASKKTNIICIQATEDPQGHSNIIKNLIGNIIPIWDIQDNTHNYDEFKKNASIAKAFIRTHQPQIEHKIEQIDAGSILDAVKIVNQFPKKYRFYNNWIFDAEKKIYIFSYKNKKIILKQGNIKKLQKETEIASKVNQLISKIKVKKRQVIAVVPKLYKINKQKGYIVSEYLGPDCNELLYQHENIDFSKNEFLNLITKLNDLSILYKGLLPRNTIIKNNKIYLIDWENTLLNQNIENKLLRYKASILIGWKHCIQITEQDIEGIFCHSIETRKDIEYLNQYEDAFKNMFGLVNLDNHQIQKFCYENIINATNYKKGFSLIKLDDILHFISEILPIEIELLIDFLLCEEYKKDSSYLYGNLSNIIKIARMKSFMELSSKQIKYFVCDQVKHLILKKIVNEYGELGIDQAIIKLIQKGGLGGAPAKNYLTQVQKFLLV